MRLASALAVPLLLASAGCSITAISNDAESRSSNECSSDSDCPNSNCSGGVCQALNGELESLLFEVYPPSVSTLPHIPFFAHVEDVPTSGGSKPISLARAAHVTGSLRLPEGSACQPTFYAEGGAYPAPVDGRSLPVNVTFTPRERLLGLSTQVYLTKARSLDATGNYTFEVQVPAGEYDVYVAPPPEQSGCTVAPQLFRRQTIAGGEVALQYPVSAANSLTLEVKFPVASGDLEGWVADIIEPLGGHSISSKFELRGGIGVSALEYTVPLAYSAVSEGPTSADGIDSANDLVRLTPPSGLVAPTVFLDRSALGLFSTDVVLLDGFTKFPSPVTVEGQIARQVDGQSAGGQVTLVSTEVFGVDPGIFASFQQTLPVDADGTFELLLPPGRYRVRAEPPMADGLAAVETTWEVPADLPYQAGKLIELPPITQVTGRTVIENAQVQAVASPQNVLPFEKAFGAAVFVPRANPGLAGSDGTFLVEADPGTFDVSVRPPESQGFAWFVRPGVEIGRGAQDLGRLAPLLPSVVSGVAEVDAAQSSLRVPHALMRVYAYLDADLVYTRDPKRAASVVQIAETRADENGSFRLLVPPSIAASGRASD